MSRRELEVEAHPVDAVARPRAQTPMAALWQRLRRRATTTPGKLALVSILVVAGALCFGLVATLAARSRSDAATAARTQTEPLLVQAVTLYNSLSDASATATTTFLTSGLEPPQRRAHYLQDLLLATRSLTTLTREVGGSSAAGGAVRTITNQLPVYTGLVESARANNLQGFPVGAAYLRQASTVLTGSILPAAKQLYAVEAQRLGDDYRSGTSNAPLVALAIALALALGILVAAQIYVARVSRRILNVWMLLATLLVLAVSVWAVVGLVGQRNALIRAQRDGSDSVEVLTASRVLLARAETDQSLTLVNRGTDETSPLDFQKVLDVLSPQGGMIGELGPLAARTGSSADAARLAREFSDYRTETAQVTKLEHDGRIADAIKLAVADSARPSYAATTLNVDLAAQAAGAQRRFQSAAADATSNLRGLSFAIPALAVVAAILGFVGIRQRAREYR